MSDYAHRFWIETERYQDIAETFERNIERTHPDYVTSNDMCVCLKYSNWCDWAATDIDYYEYRGPRL